MIFIRILLLLFSEVSGLDFFHSSEFSDFVLQLFFGFSVDFSFWFLDKSLLDESVFWLEFHQGVSGVVDESLGLAFVTSELSLQMHNNDLFGIDSEFLSNLLLNLFCGRGGTSLVYYLNLVLVSV